MIGSDWMVFASGRVFDNLGVLGVILGVKLRFEEDPFENLGVSEMGCGEKVEKTPFGTIEAMDFSGCCRKLEDDDMLCGVWLQLRIRSYVYHEP